MWPRFSDQDKFRNRLFVEDFTSTQFYWKLPYSTSRFTMETVRVVLTKLLQRTLTSQPSSGDFYLFSLSKQTPLEVGDARVHWSTPIKTVTGTDFIILRYNRIWKVKDNYKGDKYNTYSKRLYRTTQKKIVPDGIELYYGSAYIIATRDFIQWTSTDLVASNLIDWSRDTFSPDEIIWATLSRIYQQKNIVPNNESYQLTGSNKLPTPSPNLGGFSQTNDVRSGGNSIEPQLSYARTVKWEAQALKWNPPYPVCQARFLIWYP